MRNLFSLIAAAAFVLAVCNHTAFADVLNVPDDYETIQEAIDDSQDRDIVLVQPGEYVENIDFDGHNIVVIGNPDNPSEVVIDGDANGSVVYFHNGETEQAILAGFTLQNGTGNAGGHVNESYGGGIYIRGCSPTIQNCLIINNSAYFGGGIGTEYNGANPTISDCIIRNNISNSEASGGGISIDWFSSGTIERCFIEENEGCGIYGGFANITMVRCSINGNTAPNGGGAINCYNNTIVTLSHCTIFGNVTVNQASGGIRLTRSQLILVNSILWNNSPREIAFSEGGNSATINYSDLEGGQDAVLVGNAGNLTWGEGNIDEDPLFADPDNGDYHLTEDSACIINPNSSN